MPMPTSLAPGYARVTYDGTLFPHHMTIPVNYDGTPTIGVEPDLLLKDASSLNGEAAIGAFITELLPAFHTGTNFGLCEFHTVDSVTGVDQFIYAFNLGLVGSASAANIPTEEFVMTFKLSAGGLYRLYMMEGVTPANLRDLPPYPSGYEKTISDFVVSGASPIYGRTNAYPFAPISAISKYNDKLRKQQGLA
jgi:hypothetical protein